jgi:hypothetical protein
MLVFHKRESLTSLVAMWKQLHLNQWYAKKCQNSRVDVAYFPLAATKTTCNIIDCVARYIP